MPNLPEYLEQHFPWYADPTDTTNIDCQCGHTTGDGLAGWSHHLATQLLGDTQQTTMDKHGGKDSPWTYCGDPHCQDCALLGING
jgi:acetone carboxylase gamma subunit